MRNCPICNSRKKISIFDVKFRTFDNHPIKNGYPLVQCEKCYFVFADLSINQKDLNVYYKNISKYVDKSIATGTGLNKNDKLRLEETAKFIESKIDNKNIKILDIGCANGGLLKELKNLGYNNLVGIDPSPICVENTINLVGCNAYTSSFYNNAENNQFDLIILTHVLEHVLDLNEIFSTIKNLIKPNGFLYIECPDANSYYKFIHSPFQEFNTEHINHFTEISFDNLTKLNNFEKVNSGVKTFNLENNNPYFAVFGLYQQVSKKNESQIELDFKISENILKYIVLSKNLFDKVIKKIDSLDRKQPIAIFGTGQFCFKILGIDTIKEFKKIYFFDNAIQNIGNEIMGEKVLKGNQIKDEYNCEKFQIIITSLISEVQIKINLYDLISCRDISIIGFLDIYD